MTGDLIKDAMARAVATDPANRPADMASDETLESALTAMKAKGYNRNPETLEAIRAYITGYGIMLVGATRTGKTFLMKSLGCKCYDARALTDYKASGIGNWYEATDRHDVCIDDLGTESVSNDYGSKDELLAPIIAHRRELDGVVRTSITTNLKSVEISKRYGDRTLARILGMCRTFKVDTLYPGAVQPVAISQTAEESKREALASIRGCSFVMRYVELMQQVKDSGDQQELAVLRSEIVGELSQNGLDVVERATG